MAQEHGSTRTADLVAEVFAPAPLVLAFLALAGWVDAGWSGLWWGLATAVLVATVPMTVLRALARRGRVDGHFVRSRSQRTPVYAATAGLVVVVLLALHVLGAPALVSFTAGFVLTGILVLLTVTLRWKASAHTAVAVFWAIGTGVLTAWWWTLLAAWVPVVVGWSRIRTGDHTAAQTLAGACIGAGPAIGYTVLLPV